MSKFIAIDLDPQGLFAVAGLARGSQVKVEQAVAWAGTEAEGGPPSLTAESATRLGEQLRDRLRAGGVPPAPVIVSLPRDRVVLKEVRYPAVPPAEEPAVVRFQALKELSDSPDDIFIDYVPLSNGAATGERRSLVVAIRKDLYGAIRAMCETAGLRLAAVTPRPYAIAAGLNRAVSAAGTTPPPEAKSEAIAALTLGPGGGEFTITREGEVTFTKTVPAPVVANEAMLLAEVRRNLTMYAGSNPGHPVQALYVAEAEGGWAGRFRPALGIPVHSYDPLAGAAATVPEPARGRFAGAAGMLAARAGELPINFTSPRQPRTETDPKRNQLIYAALAAVLLLGLGALYGWWKLDAADKQVANLTAERDAKKKQLDALEPDAKRLAAADGWKSRKVVWLDELFDMADRFPASGGVYASSFTGKALPPDAKTGKQEHQAAVEVKVWAKTPDPVNALLAGIDRDSLDPAPKDPKNPTRFYVGVDKLIGGTTQSDSGLKEFTVFARVNGRPAEKFTRAPTFTPPPKKGYPPTPRAKEPEPADPKDKEAPEPREK